MARKHGQKDSNFHLHGKASLQTMAPDNQENMKELVSQVREVVPVYSNHQIVLVLQYYDNNVESAIAAFTEDGAAAALKEWCHTPGKKTNKTNNKKKKKPLPKQQGDESSDILNESSGSPEILTSQISEINNSAVSSDASLPRPRDPSPSISGSENTEEDSPVSTKRIADLVPESEPISVVSPRQSISEVHSHMDDHKLANSQSQHKRAKSGGSGGRRSRGPSESKELPDHSNRNSNSSTTSYLGGKGLEKSMKDLNRQTISLQRTQTLLNEELDNSLKRLKSVFSEIQQLLYDRELQLMAELDKVKKEAGHLLKNRQEIAIRLKRRVDRAQVMNESELVELRGDIKHFVSERKMDEELGRTTRFVRSSDKLAMEIKNFGEVLPVKNLYTMRRPPTPSSQSADNNNSSTTTKADSSEEQDLKHQSNSKPHSVEVEPVKSTAAIQTNFEVCGPASSMVVSSVDLTPSELADLHIRLKDSLKQQGLDNTTTFTNSNTFPRTSRSQTNRPVHGGGGYHNQSANNRSYGNWKGANKPRDQPRPNSYRSSPHMDGDRPGFRGRGSRPRIENQGPRPRMEDHGQRPRLEDHGPRPRLEEYGSRSRLEEHGPRPRLEEHGDSNNVDSEQKRSLGKRSVRPRNNTSQQSNTSQYDNKRQNSEHFNGICSEDNHRKQNSNREINVTRNNIVSHEGALPQRKPRQHADKSFEHSNGKHLINGINHEVNGLNMQNRV